MNTAVDTRHGGVQAAVTITIENTEINERRDPNLHPFLSKLKNKRECLG
jgi:hypothetical protein